MKWCRVFLLVCLNVWLQLAQGALHSYGNAVVERSTSWGLTYGDMSSRVWIDDYNTDSYPGWGFLQSFNVYVHYGAQTPVSPLRVQIWTNTSLINRFILKWEKQLVIPQGGYGLYQVVPDDGDVIEITSSDRLGFTNNYGYPPIALDMYDQTNITVHRTYFRKLDGSVPIPVVNGSMLEVNNNALKGKFSIGIVVDDSPPLLSTEVYCGGNIMPLDGVIDNGGNMIWLDGSTVLASGTVKSFVFFSNEMVSSSLAHLQLWTKINSLTYKLAWETVYELGSGPPNQHTVELSDGPVVNNTFHVGFLFEGSSLPLGYSWVNGQVTYNENVASTLPSIGSNLTFDGLQFPYQFSIGVIIDTGSSTVRTATVQGGVPSNNWSSAILLAAGVGSCLLLTFGY